MKRVIIFLLLLMNTTAFADDNISVYLNGEQLIFEQQPIIQNDSTLVPFRTIFEKLDMTVQWFPGQQRVTAQKEGILITLFIGSTEMTVNSETITLNTPPIIYNNYTLVPIRAVSEATNAIVDWDNDSRNITIFTYESTFDYWGSQVLTLTNLERENNGLNPLKWNDSLADLANEHCHDMINRDFFSHNNPDGETPFDRMKKAGISYLAAGENIAVGQYSPESVVDSWMQSMGHRENILNPKFEYMGVSVVKGGKYGIYWTQEFVKFK